MLFEELPLDDIEGRAALISAVGEEVQTVPELVEVLRDCNAAGRRPIVYDGFEPSGRLHIAQGIMKVMNVQRLLAAGCQYKMFVADWFAFLNHKLGGDIQRIQRCGQYFIECWRAAGLSEQINGENRLMFLSCQQQLQEHGDEYWPLFHRVSEFASLARIQRCTQIMGRALGDSLSVSQIFYPCMQCSDVFMLNADICQLGLDQRKVNMLAREFTDSYNRAPLKSDVTLGPDGKRRAPVVVSNHMLLGLVEGCAKMSKSCPDSAIFMDDSAEEVRRKIANAYCPTDPETITQNPLVDYVRHLLLIHPLFGNIFTIGERSFHSADELAEALIAGEVDVDQFKTQIATQVNQLLEPVRQYFESTPELRALRDDVMSYRTTR